MDSEDISLPPSPPSPLPSEITPMFSDADVQLEDGTNLSSDSVSSLNSVPSEENISFSLTPPGNTSFSPEVRERNFFDGSFDPSDDSDDDGGTVIDQDEENVSSSEELFWQTAEEYSVQALYELITKEQCEVNGVQFNILPQGASTLRAQRIRDHYRQRLQLPSHPDQPPHSADPSTSAAFAALAAATHVELNNSDLEQALAHERVESAPDENSSDATSVTIPESLWEAVADIDPDGEVSIDGLIGLGKTWNIIALNGTVKIYHMVSVDAEPLLFYKGLPEAANSKYRYEITFADLENGKLSLLVVSDTNERRGSGNRGVQVKYVDMCKTFIQIIYDAVEYSDTKTKHEWTMRGAKHLTIFENDWETIGNLVAEKLNSDDEEIQEVFPLECSFYFLFKKFGQDQQFFNPERNPSRYNPYPHLRFENMQRFLVHVAFDFCSKDHVLFFNPKFFRPLRTAPTHKYNPCVIPDTGNYIYCNIPENEHNVVAIQQYTRLFHAVHRNEYGFFDKPTIAHSMLSAYSAHLNGNAWKHTPHIKSILEPILANMYRGFRNYLLSGRQIKSRCELVWAKDMIAEPCTYTKIIQDIVKDCQEYMRETRCVDPALFTIYKHNEMANYLVNLIQPLFETIVQGVDLLRHLLNSEGTEANSEEECLTLQDFTNIFVAEGMLRRIFRGDLCGFPKMFRNLVLPVLEPDGSLLQWPFDQSHMRVNQNGLLATDIRITSCFRDFSKLLFGALRHSDMVSVNEAYHQWLQVSRSAAMALRAKASASLITEVSYAFIQRLLAYNKLIADNSLALGKLWDSTFNCAHRVPIVVESTWGLFKRLSEISRYRMPDLQPPLLYLELIKSHFSDRFNGGTQLSLAMIFDRLIYTSGVPFILKLPNRQQYAFVPYTLSSTYLNNRICGIYEQAFRASYGRDVGASQLNVRYFLKLLVAHTQQQAVDYRPRKLEGLFNVINALLDSKEEATRLRAFRRQPQDIQDILLEPYLAHDPTPEEAVVPNWTQPAGHHEYQGNEQFAAESGPQHISDLTPFINFVTPTGSPVVPPTRRVTRALAKQIRQEEESAAIEIAAANNAAEEKAAKDVQAFLDQILGNAPENIILNQPIPETQHWDDNTSPTPKSPSDQNVRRTPIHIPDQIFSQEFSLQPFRIQCPSPTFSNPASADAPTSTTSNTPLSIPAYSQSQPSSLPSSPQSCLSSLSDQVESSPTNYTPFTYPDDLFDTTVSEMANLQISIHSPRRHQSVTHSVVSARSGKSSNFGFDDDESEPVAPSKYPESPRLTNFAASSTSRQFTPYSESPSPCSPIPQQHVRAVLQSPPLNHAFQQFHVSATADDDEMNENLLFLNQLPFAPSLSSPRDTRAVATPSLSPNRSILSLPESMLSPLPSIDGSEESSPGSAHSRGSVFRFGRRIATNTPYDNVFFEGDVFLSALKATSTLEQELGRNQGSDDSSDNESTASSRSSFASSTQEQNPPPTQFSKRGPFTNDETTRIFRFMVKNKWLLYMNGKLIARTMEIRKTVHRSYQSIMSHIKLMTTKKKDRLRLVVGDEMFNAIIEAKTKIGENKKHTHILSKQAVFTKYRIRL